MVDWRLAQEQRSDSRNEIIKFLQYKQKIEKADLDEYDKQLCYTILEEGFALVLINSQVEIFTFTRLDWIIKGNHNKTKWK